MQSATFAQPERLLRAGDVWQRLGVSRSTFYALVRDEKFPAGKKVTTQIVVWCGADIDTWIVERLDAA